MKAPWATVATGAALCAASTADAWTISSSATSTTSAVHNAPLAKTWTVAGADALQTLSIHSMGRVFVDYDASLGDAVAAKIVVSSDASDLLHAIEVVDDDGDVTIDDAEKTSSTKGVKIHFQNDAFQGQGHVLTQVYVSTKHAVRNVTSAWSSDVVVGEGVLVASDRAATLGLSLIGSGDFFAGSSSVDLSVGALGVNLTGSGDLHLLAKSIAVASRLETNLAGSGDVAVIADEIAVDGTLSSLVAGSGDVFVQSAHLTARNLSSLVAGSGDITYSHAGTCDDQTIIVIGSGDVSSASIVCANTFVDLVGSGDILVQTTESLTVASMFRGDVRYYGAKPKNITSSSLFDYPYGNSHKHAKDIVRVAKKNAYHEYDVRETPERAPVFIVVKTSRDSTGDEPHVHYALELSTFDKSVVEQFLTLQNHREENTTEASWAAMAVVGGLAVVAVIVMTKRMSHTVRRHEYHAL